MQNIIYNKISNDSRVDLHVPLAGFGLELHGFFTRSQVVAAFTKSGNESNNKAYRRLHYAKWKCIGQLCTMPVLHDGW